MHGKWTNVKINPFTKCQQYYFAKNSILAIFVVLLNKFQINLYRYLLFSGSLGGNQQVTIQGSGFDVSVTTVTICGNPCEAVASATQTSSSFVCSTPPSSGKKIYYKIKTDFFNFFISSEK